MGVHWSFARVKKLRNNARRLLCVITSLTCIDMYVCVHVVTVCSCITCKLHDGVCLANILLYSLLLMYHVIYDCMIANTRNLTITWQKVIKLFPF